MGDVSEAEALMAALSSLLPFANGAAGNVVPPLRAALAALIAGDHAPTKAAPEPAAKFPREAPRPASRGPIIGVRRIDPSWPGIRNRVRAAMTKRRVGAAAIARVVEIQAGTLRKYLAPGGTVPPPDVRERLLAWVDQPAAVSPSPEASNPPAPRAAPPPVNVREVTAAPTAPFRIGASEATARV